MRYYSSEEIDQALDFSSLVEELRSGFTSDYFVPTRSHVDYHNPKDNQQNTMLLMPAIKTGELAGVKIVNVSPLNTERNLPSIQGIYYLLDATTGEPKAIFDAKSLTNWRTAATSALAATYLATKEASSLLMIGTGVLAPFLVRAHQSARPIKELFVYGRSTEKAEAVIEEVGGSFESATVVEDLADAIPKADIISAATLTEEPLIYGEYLRPGQHIDLVGAFKPTRREADDEVIRRAEIYVDSLDTAPKEAGDLAIPLSKGVIDISDIRGDLFQLCKGQVLGRSSKEEITVFKCVGHALEDLVAAQLISDRQNV